MTSVLSQLTCHAAGWNAPRCLAALIVLATLAGVAQAGSIANTIERSPAGCSKGQELASQASESRPRAANHPQIRSAEAQNIREFCQAAPRSSARDSNSEALAIQPPRGPQKDRRSLASAKALPLGSQDGRLADAKAPA